MLEFVSALLPALPEVLLFAGIFVLFSASVLKPDGRWFRRPSLRVTQMSWLILWSLVLLAIIYDVNDGLNFLKKNLDPTLLETTFSGMLSVNIFTKFGKLVLGAWGLLALVFLFRKEEETLTDDICLSLALSLLGSFLALSANDIRLLTLGVSMTGVGTLFWFSGCLADNRSLTFLLYKTLGIGLALFSLGLASLYAALGTTDLILLSQEIGRLTPFSARSLASYLGIFCVTLGLCSYMLLFPFHGVGEKLSGHMSAPRAIFFQFLLRTPTFFLLLRLFALLGRADLGYIFFLFGFINVALGWVGVTTRRSLASAIMVYGMGEIGAYFVGLSVAGLDALPSILLMLLASLLAQLVMFGAFIALNSQYSSLQTFDDLGRTPPQCFMARWLIGLSLLSCAGLPPFPGLLSFLVFAQNIVEHEAQGLLILIVILKLISMGLGLKVVQSLASREASPLPFHRSSERIFPVLSCGLALLLIFGTLRIDRLTNFLSLIETNTRSYTDVL